MLNFKKERFVKFLTFLQVTLVLLIAYKTSFTLRPFIDEIVSLSSTNNFFKTLEFKGPENTVYGNSYSPNLTTGPLVTIGSNIGVVFFKDLYIIRYFNFLFLITIQTSFNFLISRKFNISIYYLTIFSLFLITSVPWWYSSLYSLGDLICSLIFCNCLLLYKYFPRSSIFLMSFTIFFGRILILVPFCSFYFYNLYSSKKISIKELLLFLTPPVIWLILVLNFSTYQNLSEYIKNYFEIVYSTNPSIGLETKSNSLLNFENMRMNSDLRFWNTADYLRVLFSPMLILFIIFRPEKFNLKKFQSVRYSLFFSYIIMYVLYWFFSPTKSIIYTQTFTTIVLYTVLLYFIENKHSNSFSDFIPLLIVLFYFSSITVIIVSLLFYLFKKVLNISLDIRLFISILIIFNSLNSYFEISNKTLFNNINFSFCNENLQSISCFENYLNNEYKFED